MGHLYLRRRVGRTWATSSLQCLTSRQPPVVRGTVRWSAAASALPHRQSPAIRGQGHYLPVDLLCLSCHATSHLLPCINDIGRGLV
ncbi:hypothetical protein BHE74_00015142 [Ensete ventricosum]|nr:hypothetical protein GW17_00025693 [Ensete ventricosum]RWW76740.1 hypothetical protein BHE74_00015142 [Ensete ventricosum]